MKIVNCKLEIKDTELGFTLVELLVVVGITALLAAIVTVDFQKLRTTQEIQATANDIVSKIRGVQNYVLAGRVVPGSTTVADSYDMVFTASRQSYTIDYIFHNPNSTTTAAETLTLPQNVRINQVLVGGTPRTPVRVKVRSPFGKVSVDGAANQSVEIDLRHLKTSQVKKVLIDGISGRISLTP